MGFLFSLSLFTASFLLLFDAFGTFFHDVSELLSGLQINHFAFAFTEDERQDNRHNDHNKAGTKGNDSRQFVRENVEEPGLDSPRGCGKDFPRGLENTRRVFPWLLGSELAAVADFLVDWVIVSTIITFPGAMSTTVFTDGHSKAVSALSTFPSLVHSTTRTFALMRFPVGIVSAITYPRVSGVVRTHSATTRAFASIFLGFHCVTSTIPTSVEDPSVQTIERISTA